MTSSDVMSPSTDTPTYLPTRQTRNMRARLSTMPSIPCSGRTMASRS
jgi:hypothetical protein